MKRAGGSRKSSVDNSNSMALDGSFDRTERVASVSRPVFGNEKNYSAGRVDRSRRLIASRYDNTRVNVRGESEILSRVCKRMQMTILIAR